MQQMRDLSDEGAESLPDIYVSLREAVSSQYLRVAFEEIGLEFDGQ